MPKIIVAAICFIINEVKANIKFAGGEEAISSYSKLLQARTITFHNNDGIDYQEFKKSIALLFKELNLKLKEQEATSLASSLLFMTYELLKEGNEIA